MKNIYWSKIKYVYMHCLNNLSKNLCVNLLREVSVETHTVSVDQSQARLLPARFPFITQCRAYLTTNASPPA